MSEIKKTPYTRDDVLRCFQAFMKNGSSALLFLRHIERIKLLIRNSTDTQPKLIYSIEIKGLTDDMRRSRNLMDSLQGELSAAPTPALDNEMSKKKKLKKRELKHIASKMKQHKAKLEQYEVWNITMKNQY
jgi:hypothetical protein